MSRSVSPRHRVFHGELEASYPDTAKEERWSPRKRLFLIVGASALSWLVILVSFFLWG